MGDVGKCEERKPGRARGDLEDNNKEKGKGGGEDDYESVQ